MATPARLAGVGLFVVTGVLLFATGLFMIGERQLAFARKFVVYTEFKTITGLQPGAIVRISGAPAGSVTDIEPPPDPTRKFRARLEITEDLHQLVRTDSVAAIQTEGLIGGSFLAIGAGTAAAERAVDGSTIPSREPFLLADLFLPSANATIVEQLTDEGRARLDAAIAPSLSRLPDAILMIEGYSQAGAVANRYIVSRTRAALVREYLIARFHLDPGAVGLMPLGSEAVESPQGSTWSGVALAVFSSR